MPQLCKYCSSPRVHRSHRYGYDYIAAFLFGALPYRCSQCGRRFRVKRGEFAAAQQAIPPADAQASETPDERVPETPKRRHHHRSVPQAPKRKSKRQFLREALLYALALGAFAAFLRWISEDHSSSPPPQ